MGTLAGGSRHQSDEVSLQALDLDLQPPGDALGLDQLAMRAQRPQQGDQAQAQENAELAPAARFSAGLSPNM